MGSSGSGKSTFMNVLGRLDSGLPEEIFLKERKSVLSRDQWAYILNKRMNLFFRGLTLYSKPLLWKTSSRP